MKLFVGNATRQNHTFSYTLPEKKKEFKQPIPYGCQEQIAGDFNPEEIDHIISQHSPYGLIRDTEIDRAREFHGHCYSIDKPITSARLTYLVNRNMDVLVMRGKQTRQAAAVAQNVEFQRQLVENDRPEQITNFEVTIQEDRLPDDPNPNMQIAEGFRVVRGNRESPSPSPRSARSVRRKAA